MFVYGIMLVPKVSLHINVHFNIVCTNHRFFQKVTSHQHGGSRKRTQVSRGENKASGEQIEISDYFERAPLLFVSLYLWMDGDEIACWAERRVQLLMERKQKEPSVLPLSHSTSSMPNGSLSSSLGRRLPHLLPLSCPLIFINLGLSLSFPLFHFSQLSTSPSLTPLQLSHNSSLLSGRSEHSVEIGSVTVSLETDRVWLPGVSAQQKSKTAVTSVKSSYLSHSQSPSVCVRSCRQLLCEYGFERLSACLWMCLHPGIIIISIDLNFLSWFECRMSGPVHKGTAAGK